MRKPHLLTIVASLVLASGTVFADEPPPPVEIGASSGSGSAAPVGWSEQIIDNALTMPKGDIGMYADVVVQKTTSVAAPVPPQTMGVITHNTALEPLIGAGYGVTDELTIGGEYAVPVADGINGAFPNAGSLRAFGGYSLLRDATMAFVAGGDLDFEFTSGTPVLLHLGASFRYKVASNVIVYTGNVLAPGPYGEQLTIALHGGGTSFDLPVGAGFQPSPKLFAWVETTLAHLAKSSTVIFADYLPLQVGALYRVVKDVDVGAFVAFDDLYHGGDAFAIGLMARYYRHAGK